MLQIALSGEGPVFADESDAFSPLLTIICNCIRLISRFHHLSRVYHLRHHRHRAQCTDLVTVLLAPALLTAIISTVPRIVWQDRLSHISFQRWRCSLETLSWRTEYSLYRI
ncbi:hypothetical protein C8J56DRAFT_939290 [Mycena floridula]|nr:hypothetical protein C8J56DRAFT_939290 [Mycena floridula]